MFELAMILAVTSLLVCLWNYRQMRRGDEVLEEIRRTLDRLEES